MMTFSVPSSPTTRHHQVVQLSARQKNVPTLFYCTCRRHSIHIYYRNILPISLNVVREGSSWKSGSMAWLKFLQEKASRKHSDHMLKNAHFFLTSCNKLVWSLLKMQSSYWSAWPAAFWKRESLGPYLKAMLLLGMLALKLNKLHSNLMHGHTNQTCKFCNRVFIFCISFLDSMKGAEFASPMLSMFFGEFVHNEPWWA